MRKLFFNLFAWAFGGLFILLGIFIFGFVIFILLVLVQTGGTALMWAAYKGHDKGATVLLDNGADVNLKNNVRGTARPKSTV